MKIVWFKKITDARLRAKAGAAKIPENLKFTLYKEP